MCPVQFRVDLRQRQDGSRYAFVEFGNCQHVQEILNSGPFTLDDQTVRKPQEPLTLSSDASSLPRNIFDRISVPCSRGIRRLRNPV